MRNSNRFTFKIAGFVAIVGCVLMVLLPTMTLESAQKGINLWAGVILPSLLPFFICANFMISIGIPKLIGRFFEKSFQFIFGAPGCSAFIFIISIASGYPMGAKLIGDMKRRGEITLHEAQGMLTFCSTSGPLFMLGTVGVGMFHSPTIGIIITISHYMGAILNGIVFNIFTNKTEEKYVNNQKEIEKRINYSKNTVLELFTDAIISALKTLGIIFGYIVIFSIIIDFIELNKIFHSLKEYQGAFIKGLIEMTIGCNDLAISEGICFQLKCTLATFLISFGGLSISFQSISVLYKTNIKLGYYLKTKLMHGLISGVFAYFLTPHLMLLPVNPVGNFGTYNLNFEPGMIAQLLFSTKMIIIIMFMFLLTVVVDFLMEGKEIK